MKRKETFYGVLLLVAGLVVGLIYGSQFGLPFQGAGLASKANMASPYICTDWGDGTWHCSNGKICPDNGHGYPDKSRCRPAPSRSVQMDASDI